MPFQYATVAEVKHQVRIPLGDTTQDEHLVQLIQAASASVKNYLGSASAYQADLDDDDEPAGLDSELQPVLESFGSEDDKFDRVRPEVKQAVLILVAEWFRNREGMGGTVDNYLPAPVRAILYPLRTPLTK
jgi:hypothetical protein